jgi:hypothetical protein
MPHLRANFRRNCSQQRRARRVSPSELTAGPAVRYTFAVRMCIDLRGSQIRVRMCIDLRGSQIRVRMCIDLRGSQIRVRMCGGGSFQRYLLQAGGRQQTPPRSNIDTLDLSLPNCHACRTIRSSHRRRGHNGAKCGSWERPQSWVEGAAHLRRGYTAAYRHLVESDRLGGGLCNAQERLRWRPPAQRD